MITYIAILRGINVGGNRIIKMDHLKKMFIDLDFTNVQTYIQSGNVIFTSKIKEEDTIVKCISKSITANFGFDVPVMVFNSNNFKKIILANPFSKDLQKTEAYLHITFLANKFKIENLELIEKNDFLPDEFIVIKNTIYLYCPNGYGNTKLTNSFFESKLKTIATTRNLKTCNTLLSMF